MKLGIAIASALVMLGAIALVSMVARVVAPGLALALAAFAAVLGRMLLAAIDTAHRLAHRDGSPQATRDRPWAKPRYESRDD